MSENEVVIKSGRFIKVGEADYEIRDSGAPITFVDFICEIHQFNGIVSLALGTSFRDAGNYPTVDIASRFRMNLVTAQNLHNVLGTLISDALKPQEASKVN